MGLFISKFKTYKKILKNNGFILGHKKTLKIAGQKYLLPLLPEGEYARYSGVKVPDEVLPKKNYSFLPNFISPNKNKELGMIYAQNEIISSGDRVVIIAGGRGLTAVRAAQKVGKNGKVFIYEASKERIQIIKKVIQINEVENICNLVHGVVGPAINVSGEFSSAKQIRPQDIENCDVLELDCEGAEVDILKNINFKPRAISVEVHPYAFEEYSEWVYDWLDERYNICWLSGHEGIKISYEQMKKLSKIKSNFGNKRLDNNARAPYVIAGENS